jgi:hypothetical protein
MHHAYDEVAMKAIKGRAATQKSNIYKEDTGYNSQGKPVNACPMHMAVHQNATQVGQS